MHKKATLNGQKLQDFNVILLKGNNSKMGENLDTEKKYWSPIFFMKNPYMKFQNISIHGSKVNLCYAQ